ncbi:MAG TPA: hypothetical protein VK815_09615 [Candidatus Acidoferrales bacterium]|jgi:hypothetical protein|nr:hypothetical protein [Candidatus Acidoferrales bacterium]
MNTTNAANQNNTTAAKTFTAACLGACEKIAAQITDAKDNLVAEFRGRFQNHESWLDLVLFQADALAQQTKYPHLVFPLLAAEKLQAATQWQLRQQSMLKLQPAYAHAA